MSRPKFCPSVVTVNSVCGPYSPISKVLMLLQCSRITKRSSDLAQTFSLWNRNGTDNNGKSDYNVIFLYSLGLILGKVVEVKEHPQCLLYIKAMREKTRTYSKISIRTKVGVMVFITFHTYKCVKRVRVMTELQLVDCIVKEDS